VRFRSGLLIAVLIAITGYSCKYKGGKNINEGEIHYSITYTGKTGILPREIMPKNLIVSFKNDKILFDISAPFGNSGILNLSNPKDDIFDTYISLLTWKYYYPAGPGELHPGFDEMKDIEIKTTGKTSVICGYHCKNAQVTFACNRNKVYDIWFTDEINVKDPNAGTPYKDIEGVLMDFFFVLGPAELHFDAENVYKKEVPDKTFERREQYKKISREEINQFIYRMTTL
jgi:hypothetical protein